MTHGSIMSFVFRIPRHASFPVVWLPWFDSIRLTAFLVRRRMALEGDIGSWISIHH